jgi:hypothetical protein
MHVTSRIRAIGLVLLILPIVGCVKNSTPLVVANPCDVGIRVQTNDVGREPRPDVFEVPARSALKIDGVLIAGVGKFSDARVKVVGHSTELSFSTEKPYVVVIPASEC